MFRDFFQRLRRGKYNGLNRLDQQLEKYVDYDGGYFVELGANDGVNQSNSLYFERHRGWHGVLVEPSPNQFLQCRRNRSTKNSIYCAACVSFENPAEFIRMAYSNLMTTALDGGSDIADRAAHARLGAQFLREHETVFEYGAVARTLSSLLREAQAPARIDFLSLDVEGAELEVLRGIDHTDWRFRYMLIECRDRPRMEEYLKAQGYQCVDQFSEHDYLFRDERSA